MDKPKIISFSELRRKIREKTSQHKHDEEDAIEDLVNLTELNNERSYD
jgi:hypothetical protein